MDTGPYTPSVPSRPVFGRRQRPAAQPPAPAAAPAGFAEDDALAHLTNDRLARQAEEAAAQEAAAKEAGAEDAGAEEAGAAEAAGEQTYEYDFRCFYGPHADYYIAAHEALAEHRRYTMNWAAVLGGICWLFHRKLYGVGIALTGFVAFALYALPKLVDMPGASLAVPAWFVFGIVANDYYTRRAEKAVARAYDRGLVGIERERFLAKAGGTCLSAAMLSLVVLVLIGAVAYIVAFAPARLPAAPSLPAARGGHTAASALPACNAPQVQAMLETNSTRSLQTIGLRLRHVDVDRLETVSSNGFMNVCTGRLRAGGQAITVTYAVVWVDYAHRRFDVRLTGVKR